MLIKLFLELLLYYIKYNNSLLTSLFLSIGDNFALHYFKNKNVILDRHRLLNYFWNGTEESEEIFNLEQKMFGKPDLTILLYASPSVRRKRVESRDPHDPDLEKDNMWIDGYDKMLSYLNKYEYKYILVDTDDLELKEVIVRIDDIIKRLHL